MDKDRFSGNCIKDIIAALPPRRRRGAMDICLRDLFRHCSKTPMLSLEDYTVMKEIMGYESPKITTVGELTDLLSPKSRRNGGQGEGVLRKLLDALEGDKQ